ncbi:MAG: hypothetical protein ACT452_16735 [Microthrixaceae bacterium]
MRKFLATAAAAVLATVVLGAAPASADHMCPNNDGSLPNAPARSTKVGPVYVDDRDYPDLDEDNDSGGIWLYYESGVKPNLQRGGDQIIFTVVQDAGVNPKVPVVKKIEGPKSPTTGQPIITLFPNDFGGGSISQTVGSHDDCFEGVKSERDVILF